jgi:hypothetical protein
MKTLLATILLCVLWPSGAMAEDTGGKAILDFSRPPNQLYSARLAKLDGENVNAPITKTSFWVEPGVHEITVAAAITDPMQVGTISRRQKEDQGDVTIEVEAGKRYKIAARVLDERGGWEPVVWKIEDVK